MKFPYFALLFFASLLTFSACEDDEDPMDGPSIVVPNDYTFTRNGQSTVSFSGQTTRLAMAAELVSAMKDPSRTEQDLDNMFRNTDGTNPFSDPALNASSKSLRSKVAASAELFSGNSAAAADIKQDFDQWLANQANDVFPNWNQLAQPGVPGQIADGSSVRYVNGRGLEYNQVFAKSLIGALMFDQLVNNYLSPTVLDAGTNRDDNDNGVTATDRDYTTMEHKWDEAFGYLFGASASPATPLDDFGSADNFLNKYLGRVDGDSDYTGIAQTIEEAFRRGRAAIVAGDYEERDDQAEIISDKLEDVLAIRSVYYLTQAAKALEANPANRGTAFHDGSEAYGFIYSLRFTEDGDDYAENAAEVDAWLNTINGTGNGYWDVSASTLHAVAADIADEFDIAVAEAGE